MVNLMYSNEKNNHDSAIQNNVSENDKKINDLEKQLDELKFISETTKEYLFILEKENNEKNKKINSLQKNIKKKNKQIKSLKRDYKKIKKENNILKSSNSWKITYPMRKLFNLFKR